VTKFSYNSLCDTAGIVSRETHQQLVAFHDFFLKWAERINLASPSTFNTVWERHILDSAQLRSLDSVSEKWIDLGSGGGFPGLVMAFLLKENEAGRIKLVESNRKKCGFLQAAVGTFNLPATIDARRIEDVQKDEEQFDVVTARALAPLNTLFHLSEAWLSNGAKGLFHKGRDYEAEIKETADVWQYDLIEHRSRVNSESVILEIVNLRRK